MSEQYEELRCYLCDIAFCITKSLIEKRREDGRGFFCPNGHEQHFTKSRTAQIETLTNEITALKKELAHEKSQKEHAQEQNEAAQEMLKKFSSSEVEKVSEIGTKSLFESLFRKDKKND